MTTIQLQRQGVSHSLRGNFLPCQHGAPWHIAIQEHHGMRRTSWSIPDQTEDQTTCWYSELTRPNCVECYPSGCGQVAWSNGSGDMNYRQILTVDAAKRQALRAIRVRLNRDVEFAPEIQAYMRYSAADLKIWPYIATDVYMEEL